MPFKPHFFALSVLLLSLTSAAEAADSPQAVKVFILWCGPPACIAAAGETPAPQ